MKDMHFAKTIIGLFSLLSLITLSLYAIKDLWIVILVTLLVAGALSLGSRKS